MKRFLTVFNILLIILIISVTLLNPKVNTISVNMISKSVKTDVFTGKNKDVNSIDIISSFQQKIVDNMAKADVISDVLETQVGTMSAYGLDCVGCSGRVGASYDAAGNHERYYDSTYGELRIVAGDKKYPYGTVIRVKDSNIGTFNAIVLDRGGDIGINRRYMFDLLFHTEKEASGFGLSKNTTFEVLRYGY